MSRSYKHHPVCSSHSSLKEYKKVYNRRFRRRLNRGELDDATFGKSKSYRRIENFSWVADNYKLYHDGYQSSKWWGYYDPKVEEEYQDFMKWYARK